MLKSTVHALKKSVSSLHWSVYDDTDSDDTQIDRQAPIIEPVETKKIPI